MLSRLAVRFIAWFASSMAKERQLGNGSARCVKQALMEELTGMKRMERADVIGAYPLQSMRDRRDINRGRFPMAFFLQQAFALSLPSGPRECQQQYSACPENDGYPFHTVA